MGRKSGAKKKVREMLQDKDDKKTAKKSGKSKKFQLKISRKSIFGGVLTVIMIALLISIGYLLFQRAFRAQPIAKILPADSTVALIEINTNFEHNQVRKTFKNLESHPQYSKEKLFESLGKIGLSYDEIKPWLGREIGAAVFNSVKSTGTVSTVYFFEAANRPNTEQFLKNRSATEEVYAKQTVYKIGGENPINATFVDEYFIVSREDQAIYELIDVQQENRAKLYSSAKYKRTDNNLPISKMAFAYVDFKQINNAVFQKFPLLSEKGLSMQVVAPFTDIFDAEGVALVAMDNNFAVQSFISLNPELLKNVDGITFQEKYQAKLAKYVQPDITAFWGAENLERQMKRLIEIMSGGDQSTLLVFDSLLNNYTQKYFGPDTNFNHNIMPLFANEFAFVVENFDGKDSYKLLIELESAQADAIKLHEIANNFASVGAIFEPKVVEVVLEDGTVGKEIIAIPEEITKAESTYKERTIHELQMGKQDWGIYYALIDGIAVIASSSDSIKSTIDIVRENQPNLRSTELFANQIYPVLKTSDEVSYFNFEKLLATLLKDSDLPDFVDVISSLSSGRNYFNDGIVTINYLNIK